MSDPWAFGWNQLLTVIGMGLTGVIAIAGFRTFGRWRREQLEAKRIDIAYEALALAHESTLVFGHIRSPIASSYEWQDMPVRPSETDADRQKRGPFFAVRKRIVDQRDFFDRAIKLHPRLMAVLGADADTALMQLHRARREIEVAAEMLEDDAVHGGARGEPDKDFYKQLRADIWAGVGKAAPEGDRVGQKLKDFQEGIEHLCRPIVDQSRNRGRSPTSR